MGLIKYSVDGSSLSLSDREKLIQILESFSRTGVTFVDMKKGLYQVMFYEDDNISHIPFPTGTVLNRI